MEIFSSSTCKKRLQILYAFFMNTKQSIINKIVVGNELGDTSSNPGRNSLHFT